MIDKSPQPRDTLLIPQELGLKDLSERQLFEALLTAGSEWTEAERAMVTDAYELTRVLHADDRHRRNPYIYHPLRNANRIVGYLHITDPHSITAAILHDTVEDHPEGIILAALQDGGDMEPSLDASWSPEVIRQRAFAIIDERFSR